MTSYLVGNDLPKVLEQAKTYNSLATKFRETDAAEYTRLIIQIINRFIEPSENPLHIDENGFDEDAFVQRIEIGENEIALFVYYFLKLQLSLVYGDYKHAIIQAEKALPFALDHLGFFNVPSFHFNHALALAFNLKVDIILTIV